jgi:hypothetical protein
MKPNEGDIWVYGYMGGHKEYYLLIEYLDSTLFNEQRWSTLNLETGLVEQIWLSTPAYKKVA